MFKRNKKDMILLMDNCLIQNKNLVLYKMYNLLWSSPSFTYGEFFLKYSEQDYIFIVVDKLKQYVNSK